MFRCRGQPARTSEHRRHSPSPGRLRVPRARFAPTRGAAGKLIGQRSEHRPQNAARVPPRGDPRRGCARSRNNAGRAHPNGGETAFASAAPHRCARSETPKRNIGAIRARGPRLLKSPGSGRPASIEPGRAVTRRLTRPGSDAAPRATPPRNGNIATRTANVPTYRRDQGPPTSTRTTPAKARQTPPGSVAEPR